MALGVEDLKCKFTPLGFETPLALAPLDEILFCVNLPRWGLKLKYIQKTFVNL